MKKLLERLKALREAIEKGLEAHKSETGEFDWTKVGTIASFTVPETDGAKEWAKAADATLDFSKMENDAARTTAATGLYDLYDAAKTEVERLQEEEKEAAKAATDLRERTLSALVPVGAPAIITRGTQSQEFNPMSAVERAFAGEQVPLPREFFVAEKMDFHTLGGRTIERSKAALSFAARWPVLADIPQLAFQPTLFDYLRSFPTDAGSWPIRQATSASDANVGVQSTAGTALSEAALIATIQDNNLHAVGSWHAVTRQQRRVPGAMQWAMESLGMAVRAEVDKRMVGGAGNLNGLGDRTYPAARKVAVATSPASVLDGLADAVAASYAARGIFPDFVCIGPVHYIRAIKEAKTNSGYMTKGSPEALTSALWNMTVVPTNHAAATKAYVGYSMDIASVLHSAGFMMETGLSGTDFTKLQETLRAFVEMQMIFDREESLVELTITA